MSVIGICLPFNGKVNESYSDMMDLDLGETFFKLVLSYTLNNIINPTATVNRGKLNVFFFTYHLNFRERAIVLRYITKFTLFYSDYFESVKQDCSVRIINYTVKSKSTVLIFEI